MKSLYAFHPHGRSYGWVSLRRLVYCDQDSFQREL